MDIEYVVADVGGTGGADLYVGVASGTSTGVGVIKDEEMVWFFLQCRESKRH